MAKKPKNKKPSVVASVQDVSETPNETISIPSAPKGPAEPETGLLPETVTHPFISLEQAYGRVHPQSAAIIVGDVDDLPQVEVDIPEQLKDINVTRPDTTPYGYKSSYTVHPETPDMRGQVAIDTGKETDAIVGIQSEARGTTSADQLVGKIRELAPDAMEVNEDPVAKFNDAIVVEPRGSNVEPLQTGKEWDGKPLVGSYQTLPGESLPLREPVIGGVFKEDKLKELLPDTYGFQMGKLYLFAFNSEVKHLPDISAWLDNNIEWVSPDKVDFYYFNQSSERAHVRHYRERALKEDRIAVGILSVPPHCLMMEPFHIPHSQEADGVFVFSGTKLVRDKYRGVLNDDISVREVTI